MLSTFLTNDGGSSRYHHYTFPSSSSPTSAAPSAPQLHPAHQHQQQQQQHQQQGGRPGSPPQLGQVEFERRIEMTQKQAEREDRQAMLTFRLRRQMQGLFSRSCLLVTALVGVGVILLHLFSFFFFVFLVSLFLLFLLRLFVRSPLCLPHFSRIFL